MPEYIEREGVEKIIKKLYQEPKYHHTDEDFYAGVCAVAGGLATLPTADVAAVKHGEWLTKEYQYGKDNEGDEWVEKTAEQGDCAYCSLCLKDALLNGGEEYVLSNYCPNCGAKMDGKENGNA